MGGIGLHVSVHVGSLDISVNTVWVRCKRGMQVIPNTGLKGNNMNSQPCDSALYHLDLSNQRMPENDVAY